MKKQQLFNFALTTMCVAVLSACGSSGGGSLAVENTPTTPSANTNTGTGAGDNSAALAAAQKAAQEAAAKQAAAEQAAKDAAAKQAAAEQAAKDAAAKAKEDTAKAVEQALKDKEAADKKAAEDQAKAAEEAAKKAAQEAAEKAASGKTNPFGAKDQLAAEPDTARETSFVGFKQTVKVNSNLATNTSTKSDSTSDVPTPMALQKPHASLDNIVVAEPKGDAGAARVYLEDFDTRFVEEGFVGSENTVNRAAAAAGGIRGNRTLLNIYKQNDTNKGLTTSKLGDPEIEKQREALQKAVEAAEKAVLAEKQKAVDINRNKYAGEAKLTYPDANKSKLEIIAAEYAQVDIEITKATTGANDDEVTALRKVRKDALNAEKSRLEGELAQISQKVDGLQSNLIQATSALQAFAAKHPKPVYNPANDVSTKREEAQGIGYDTKTDTIGKEKGAIWTFAYEDVRHKHQNFTEHSKEAKKENRTVKKGFVYAGKDMNGNIIATAHVIDNLHYSDVETKDAGRELQARNLDETVAEVYGYRSKAFNQGKGFTTPLDTMDYTTESIDAGGGVAKAGSTVIANNLPLVNEYHGAKLENVQYGRVTTALDGKEATDQYLKEGLQLNQHGTTYVASFGEYGKEGTENHYFFRGINNVGGTELTQLKKDEKNGIITYNGHAVTYGLDNNFRGNIPIPTAFGARTGFVSGNHVSAAVNLANGNVTGNIYNKWFDSYNSPKDLVQVNLVSFKGTLADNGNIAGTSTRIDNGTSGLFGATLYGKGAEMGGIIASEATGADKWGGSFGAIRVPATPEEKAKAGMAVGADEKN